MPRETSTLAAVVRVAAAAAVLAVVCVASAAVVVRATEDGATEPPGDTVAPAAPSTPSTPSGEPDPFAVPPGGWVFTNWAIQDGGGGSSYRVPPGWRASTTGVVHESTDADGAVLARGTAPAYYYGNRCTDRGSEVPAAWAVLAEPVAGDDLAAAAEDAVTAWARGFARNDRGTVAPVSAPTTTETVLADGTEAVRSWVSVDMTVFSGPCLPREAQVVATTAAGTDGLHTLVQTRYLLDAGGVAPTTWAGVAASLRVR